MLTQKDLKQSYILQTFPSWKNDIKDIRNSPVPNNLNRDLNKLSAEHLVDFFMNLKWGI